MGENGEIISEYCKAEDREKLEKAIDDGNHKELVEILKEENVNLRSYWDHDKKVTVIDKILTDAVNGNEVVKKESIILVSWQENSDLNTQNINCSYLLVSIKLMNLFRF